MYLLIGCASQASRASGTAGESQIMLKNDQNYESCLFLFKGVMATLHCHHELAQTLLDAWIGKLNAKRQVWRWLSVCRTNG
jgi:hypothetical protein